MVLTQRNEIFWSVIMMIVVHMMYVDAFVPSTQYAPFVPMTETDVSVRFTSNDVTLSAIRSVPSQFVFVMNSDCTCLGAKLLIKSGFPTVVTCVVALWNATRTFVNHEVRRFECTSAMLAPPLSVLTFVMPSDVVR